MCGAGSAVLPLLHAQTATNAPATNAPATNAPATNAPATNAPSDTGTNTPPAATNAPEMEGPPSPGSMANPSEELIGPPAPNQPNAPAGSGGGYEGNPAVTDITNNPGAAAGLGQRRLPFYFGLDLGEMYDDNILISPDSAKQGALITHIKPSIDYQLGDQTAVHMNYLNLYFSPTFYIYEDLYGYGRENSEKVRNRADYDGDIYYQYTWTRLSLGFEQRYQHLTDASLDEGTLVSRNLYTTKITASYIYNDNLTLYNTTTQQISNFPGENITEYDVDDYALYELAPKLSLGAGPRIAFLNISDGPDEQHQDMLFRLKYLPDKRFTVGFDGGAEYLQYQGSTPSRVLPIFDGSITYEPFEDTSVYASAGRNVINSFEFHGDTIDYTNIEIGGSQRFLNNYKATAVFGYALSQYQGSSGNSEPQRQDNYFYAKGLVEWTPNQWFGLQASYQWSDNDSTFAQSKFTDNQIDIQSSVKF
jgi:hypothetical protein